MRRITLGTEVGIHSVKMVWAARVKETVRVYASECAYSHEPLISEQSGMILNFDEICRYVNRFIDSNKIRSKTIALSINSKNTVLRVCEVSSAPIKDIYRAVKKNIGSYFKFNISDYVADFCVQPTNTGADANGIPLLLAAVQSDVVASYMELCRRLKLKPLYFDTQASCLHRMFKHCEQTDLPWMVIDVGEDEATAIVVANGRLEMCRSFSIDNIDQAVLLKNYYGRIHANATIDNVMLTGTRAGDNELQRTIEIIMDAKVRVSDAYDNEVFSVIGLILRGRTKALNLLPADYKSSQEASQANRMILAAGVFLIPAAAIALLAPPYLLKLGNTRLQTLMTVVNDSKYNESDSVAADIISVTQELEVYRNMYERLADGTFSTDTYNKLLKILPDEITLTEVHMTADGEYLLIGFAKDRATAAGFAEIMSAIPNINVDSISIGLPTDNNRVKLEMRLSVMRKGLSDNNAY